MAKATCNHGDDSSLARWEASVFMPSIASKDNGSVMDRPSNRWQKWMLVLHPEGEAAPEGKTQLSKTRHTAPPWWPAKLASKLDKGRGR
ncbi:unnamed protein product [Miscanthus lutarioriparius]|uniref:Uncharacterized protein n=1 Tax=Miscanthus lutarioriparius TaxID=422564 RepID=A0A811S7W8_9POAL|nr:unnamed protein product [Miscanthus lutarioriparius]